MPRTLRLIAIGHQQRPVEGIGMRPRQHGERCDPLRKTIGQRPGNAAAPVVADQMEAAIAVAAGRNDRHRIVHQAFDMIIRGVIGVRPRAGRIAALARSHRAIAGGGEGGHLCAPAMHGFRKAVQQQHQRRPGFAADEGVERQTGCDGDLFELGHGSHLSTRRSHLDI